SGPDRSPCSPPGKPPRRSWACRTWSSPAMSAASRPWLTWSTPSPPPSPAEAHGRPPTATQRRSPPARRSEELPITTTPSSAPIARTAAEAGFTVTAFDLSPDARQALADVTMPAETALAAAQGADVVVIMVATPEQLDSVLFGDGGIAPALTARTTLLIMSTV